MVTVVLLKHTKKKLASAKDEKNHKKVAVGTFKTLISIISVMLMFGLSWLFGALTVSAAAPVFQWPFVILNTLQGFLLFLFFCVIGKDARDEWKKLLTCNRYKGAKKSTATPSGVSTGVKARMYSTKDTSLTSRAAASNTIRRSVGLLPKGDSGDFDSSTAPLELSVYTPADGIEAIEEETDMVISNGDAEFGSREELKPLDSQLPPQVLFRLKRPFYDVIIDQDSIPSVSPECSDDELAQTVLVNMFNDEDSQFYDYEKDSDTEELTRL